MLNFIVPALAAVLPSAIDLAERLFEKRSNEDKRGAEKKSWVIRVIRVAWNVARERGKLPKWAIENEALVFELLDALIDELVAAKRLSEVRQLPEGAAVNA